MEYQQKKQQILNSVQFTNLLTFNLVENKLERNFKAIVDALLLNQGRTEEAINKTDQLEDRLALERQKNLQQQQGFRGFIKHLNDRISKLEVNTYSQGQPSASSIKGDTSKKQQKDTKESSRRQSKRETSKKQLNAAEVSPSMEINSAVDKKIEEAFQQINMVKQKMPVLQFLENEFDNLKRDISVLKGQLMTLKNHSQKAIKRDSLGNVFKRQSSAKLGKSSIINFSNSNSNAFLEDAQNKQSNKDSIKENTKDIIDIKETGKRLDMSQSDKQDNEELDKQLEGLHVEVNTLHLCFEELKVFVEELRKKDIKSHSILSQVEDRQRKMQDEMRKDSQNFERQIKNIQVDLLNNQHIKEQEKNVINQQNSKRGKGSSKNVDNSYEEITINFKNQINDRFSKIQGSLQGFVTQNQFNRFKGQSRNKMEDIEKKHDKFVIEYEDEIKKIYDMLINKDLDINRLGELINSTSEVIKENAAQAERKHNIAIARADELKKNLQNLREDVEFYQSINADNKKNAEVGEKKLGESTIEEQSNREKEKEKEKGNVDTHALQDLKKYFNNKLHDQRAYLVGLVRDIEKKQQAAGGFNQEIANMWDKIHELVLFLGKKADAEDIKKNLIYLEKKISRLGAHLLKVDQNSEDALISRKNWFCLSCDKSLADYQGKVGKHLVWETMPVKGLVKTVDKRSLPSLKIKQLK